MGHSLCIIDDGFMKPARDLSLELHRHFSISTIDVFLGHDWDTEHSLKDLCTIIVNDKDDGDQKQWQLTAFTNPQFFLDAFNEDNFRSDIIIFDWEYSTISDFDQKSFLKEILEKSHSYIFIFSGADKIDEINKLLADELNQYKHRIDLLDKENNNKHRDSHTRLHKLIKEKQRNNFAFKFGKNLRIITNKSLDDVLLHLSDMDIDKIIKHFGEEESESIDTTIKELIGIKIKDKIRESKDLQSFLRVSKLKTFLKIGQFAEIISEKIKNDIIQSNLIYTPSKTQEALEEDGTDDALEKLWSYRLYHHNDDGFVRTGDLIKKAGEYDGVLYLVLTGSCDLHRFWKSTGSRINLVELLDISLHAEVIKNTTALVENVNSNYKRKISAVSSLTNGMGLKAISGKPLMMPYVPVPGEDKKKDFLLFPKNIHSSKLEMPSALTDKSVKKRNIPLRYEHCDYELVCAISDPFLAPLIGTVISDLFGWGVPDFSSVIQNTLGNKAKGVLT